MWRRRSAAEQRLEQTLDRFERDVETFRGVVADLAGAVEQLHADVAAEPPAPRPFAGHTPTLVLVDEVHAIRTSLGHP